MRVVEAEHETSEHLKNILRDEGLAFYIADSYMVRQGLLLTVYVCVCVCMRACVCMCVHVCVLWYAYTPHTIK